jgi:hypothetical protein
VKASKLGQALRHILDAQEQEILCSECLDLISDYVDAEIAGEPVARQMPEVKYHLEHCGVCEEEYETLRDLARLEAEGGLPAKDQIEKSF